MRQNESRARTHADERSFWDHAAELLERPGVTRSTMMGYPCLRVAGAFFACFDRINGGLVVKLPAVTVTDLLATGAAFEFAPNGRRFKEWARLPLDHQTDWTTWLDEAFDFVAGTTTAP